MPNAHDYTCTISEARVYTLKGNAKGYGRWWAEITIKEWSNGGSVNIQSESGNYANFWTAIGEGPFRKFLCKLNFDYFMEKCRGSAYKEFDAEQTIRELQERVIEGRREGWLEPDAARDIWNDLVDVSVCSASSIGDLLCVIDGQRIVSELYDGDWYDAPNCEKPRQECLNFWRHIWPCACEVWKKELENA